MVAFVVSVMIKVELITVYRGCIGVIVIIGVFIATALAIIFPELATWLSSLVA